MKTKYGKNSILAFGICLFLFITSCRNNDQIINTNVLPVNDTTCIKQGETYRNLAENISLRLDSVLDGRCKPWMMCFWEGNAAVSFSFVKGNEKHSLILNTSTLFRTDTLIGDYDIKLITLNQPDFSTENNHIYIATVLIRK